MHLQYVRLLEQLADTLKMDAIVRKLGVEVNGETLLARAEQLVRIEQEAMGKKAARVQYADTQVSFLLVIFDEKECAMKKDAFAHSNGPIAAYFHSLAASIAKRTIERCETRVGD